jgi:1-acyl-sn-glycerol-3-phosphate acyltransferase
MTTLKPEQTQRAYNILKWSVVGPLLEGVFRIRVNGTEQVPKTGAFLLVCNHASNLDPVIVAHSAARPVAFMAKEELFRVPILKDVIRTYGAFPVKRGSGDRGAFRVALEALNAGWAVGIFLNGTRTEDGRIPTPQLGASMIAAKAGVSLLPMAISGSERILPKGKTIPTLAHLHVSFGELIPAPQNSDRETLRSVTQQCTEQIHEMLDLLLKAEVSTPGKFLQ